MRATLLNAFCTEFKTLTEKLKSLRSKIKKLFILEDIEVTFTKEGDTTNYSYTKYEE